MSGLKISLLGPFQVTLDGVPVTRFGAGTARALLPYLAMAPHTPHRRETLAGLLWPDQPESEARHNLSQALLRLRAAIGDRDASPPFLLATRETIQLNPESDYWLDVSTFEQAVAFTRHHRHRRVEDCAACAEHLGEAVELYQGEFLAGFTLASALFEEWAVLERERLHRHALEALGQLAAYHEAQGAYAEAAKHARRALALEPWSEAAHRQLMRGLALSGDRGAALAQYEACCRVLQEELGVEPEEETRRLYERIRDAQDLTGLPNLSGLSAIPPHDLPSLPTPTVGREDALSEIDVLLDVPDCHLLTLVGLGGIGKTRLAIEAARQRAADYADGTHFVPLAGITSPSGVVSAIAGAVGFTLSEGGDPIRQLLGYLRGKEMLLVLDNYEHLLANSDHPTALVSELLRTGRRVQLLVTSRERLNVRGEHLYPVQGMRYPQEGEAPEQVVACSAVQLFLANARRVRPGYAPSGEELSAVGRLCRAVGGMPLAIELAAAWMDALSVTQLTAAVAGGLQFLQSEMRDLPPRHRSMRAACDASWRLLDDHERHALARLAVFQGSFTPAAAEAVAGADLRTLTLLLRKSLLQRELGDRYGMHPLLREYATEKLDEIPGERERARDRHCAYYVGFYTSIGATTLSGRVVVIAPEAENMWAAWRWAITRRRMADIRCLVGRDRGGLYRLYRFIGRRRDEGPLFVQAIDVLRASEQSNENRLALGVLLRALGMLRSWEGHRDRAIELIEESCTLFRELGEQEEWVGSTCQLYLLSGRSHDPASERLLRDALAVSRENGLRDGEVEVLFLLGGLLRSNGAYVEAERCFGDMLAICAAEGHPGAAAWARTGLGGIAYLRGDYERAKHYHTQALSTFQGWGLHAEAADLLNHVGSDATALGEYGEARVRYLEALDTGRRAGYDEQVVRSLVHLGSLALAQGAAGEARSWYRRALELAVERANPVLAAGALLGPATWYTHEAGERAGKESATELLALAVHEPCANILYQLEQLALKALQAELPPGVFEAARERGAARDLWETVHELLAELGSRGGSPEELRK
jgi:predicted ATPase/DNA-binding SARP family transcriptional activator